MIKNRKTHAASGFLVILSITTCACALMGVWSALSPPSGPTLGYVPTTIAAGLCIGAFFGAMLGAAGGTAVALLRLTKS